MDTLALSGKTNFALTTDALAFMQAAYSAFEKLAALGGDNYVVSGCTESGTSVTSGWMVLNGKLMPFNGGTVQTNVQIIQTTAPIKVGSTTREETTYHAEFGTSSDTANNVAYADIARLTALSNVLSANQINKGFFRVRGALDTDVNLNDLNTQEEAGIYYPASIYETPLLSMNYPLDETYGSLIVTPTVSNGTAQIFITQWKKPRVFVRCRWGEWTKWSELAPLSDVYTKEEVEEKTSHLLNVLGVVAANYDGRIYHQKSPKGLEFSCDYLDSGKYLVTHNIGNRNYIPIIHTGYFNRNSEDDAAVWSSGDIGYVTPMENKIAIKFSSHLPFWVVFIGLDSNDIY
jgi:hypothetical protein